MVQGGWPREPYARQQWHQDRFVGEPTIEDGRSQEPRDLRRQPPLSIERALREYCNIPAQHYFVAAILDDGSERSFSSPGRSQLERPRLFNWQSFRRHVGTERNPSSTVSSFDELDAHFGPNVHREHYASGYDTSFTERSRHGSTAYGEEESVPRPRKRNRGLRRGNDDEPPMMGPARRGLKIGETDEVWAFYDQRFKNCQQTACKLIAKAWVKVVEPKKQTNHPYTGSEERRPDWWPAAWGPSREEKVRHKEPDHLYKKERVHLLCHILRLVIQPKEKQLPSIQRLNLNVDKLKEATDEALSMFFSGKENEKNAQRKPFLDEIFKVAKFEQRFMHGEIDGDTQVFVMAEDRFSDSGKNDDVGEDELQSLSTDTSPPKSSVPSVGLMHGNSTDQSPETSSFVGEVPIRGPSQYSAQMIPPNMHADQHLVDNGALHTAGTMPLHDIVPSPQEGHRRASLFTPSAEYQNPSPSVGAGFYAQPWSAGSAAPPTGSMYSFPPQQQQQPPPTQGHFGNHPAVSLAQGQYMGAAPYDGLPRGSFDQGTLFRPSSATTQGQVANPQPFPGYMTSDVRAVTGAGDRHDGLPRDPRH